MPESRPTPQYRAMPESRPVPSTPQYQPRGSVETRSFGGAIQRGGGGGGGAGGRAPSAAPAPQPRSGGNQSAPRGARNRGN
jgi:hypothetical protein